MVLDFRKVRPLEFLVGGAGVGLLVVMAVAPWYGSTSEVIDFGSASTGLVEVEHTWNAFEVFSTVDLVLLATAVAAIALPPWRSLEPPVGPPFAVPAVVAMLAVVSIALIVVNLITTPDFVLAEHEGFEVRASDEPGVGRDRRAGPWLALVASTVIAGASALSVRRSPESVP